MKITAVRVFKVSGVTVLTGEFWEERLVRPVDIYPEHKTQGAASQNRRRTVFDEFVVLPDRNR